MAGRPWVSILTPVYNGWEHLEQCALSVFMQITGVPSAPPYFEWEWIIGINGHGESGGPAMEAARRVAYLASLCHLEGVGTVKVVNLPDAKGKVAALNALTAMTEAPWIAVLDCDDTWDREKLVQQWLTAQGMPEFVAVIGTMCSYFGDIISHGPQLPTEYIYAQTLFAVNPIINSSAIIRREHAHWEDSFFGIDDYDLWFRILLQRGKVAYNIPKRLVHHRIHATSAFNGSDRQAAEIARIRAYYSQAPFSLNSVHLGE